MATSEYRTEKLIGPDVVPVLPATRDLWTHDPYGGEYDGTYIWGRGSSDDKSGLIGIL